MQYRFLLLAVVFVLVGCSSGAQVQPVTQDPAAVQPPTDPLAEPLPGTPATHFEGTLLAGDEEVAPFLSFTLKNYEHLAGEAPLVLLAFYNPKDPISLAEQPELAAAFAARKDQQVAGLRVTMGERATEAERSIAQQFAVTDAHAKILVKQGAEVVRQVEAWDRSEFDRAVTKALAE